MTNIKIAFSALLNASRPKQIGVLISIHLLFLIFVYIFIISPHWGYLEKLKDQSFKLKQQIDVQQQEIFFLKNYKKKLKESERIFKSQSRYFLRRLEIADFLNDVSQLGFSNQLQFKLVKPLPEQTCQTKGFVKIPLEITVVGSYHQLLAFLTQLSSLPWLVMNTDFTLKPEIPLIADTVNVNKEQLTLQIILQSYYYEE